MIQEWYELKKLTGVGGLPTTVQGITKKAKLENWQRRRVAGVKGNVFEYYVGDMPSSVQQALGLALPLAQQASLAPSPTQAAQDMERIPFYDVRASAGFGAFNPEKYAPDDYMGLSQRWLAARGLYLSHLAFITASGDSMYPTISDGDMLLINMEAKQPKDGKIFVLRQGNQLWVKRVQGILNGIRLISDNQELYRPVDVLFDEMVDFEVIGQVVYIGHDSI